MPFDPEFLTDRPHGRPLRRMLRRLIEDHPHSAFTHFRGSLLGRPMGPILSLNGLSDLPGTLHGTTRHTTRHQTSPIVAFWPAGRNPLFTQAMLSLLHSERVRARGEILSLIHKRLASGCVGWSPPRRTNDASCIEI